MQKRIDVTINWVGDQGYLPVRPDYLVADLKTSDNSSIMHKRLIECDKHRRKEERQVLLQGQGNLLCKYKRKLRIQHGRQY